MMIQKDPMSQFTKEKLKKGAAVIIQIVAVLLVWSLFTFPVINYYQHRTGDTNCGLEDLLHCYQLQGNCTCNSTFLDIMTECRSLVRSTVCIVYIHI